MKKKTTARPEPVQSNGADQKITVQCVLCYLEGRRGKAFRFAYPLYGWDKHISSLTAHPHWHPEVMDRRERRRLFELEYPDFPPKTPEQVRAYEAMLVQLDLQLGAAPVNDSRRAPGVLIPRIAPVASSPVRPAALTIFDTTISELELRIAALEMELSQTRLTYTSLVTLRDIHARNRASLPTSAAPIAAIASTAQKID